MNTRPILFSAPMVRTLLDGSKTQTRRIVKPQPFREDYMTDEGVRRQFATLAPYGQPGDRLWVRETHRPIFGQTCGLIAIDYRADPREKWERLGDQIGAPTKWTPSIHMKREYSRILLEIVSVRVERLNDCSEVDARAEGIFFTDYGRRCGHGGLGWKDVGNCEYPEAHHPQRDGWMWDKTATHEQCIGSARSAYGALWESINGAGSWAANPWVFVIEFKRVTA